MNEDIKESLKDIYPDKWEELFLFSIFRLLNNTPIKNLQTYYATSFLSETLPGAYLSPKKVGNLLREIGKERERTKEFLKQFISGNEFALIDLTGYITEGQFVLSRDLHRRGIYPPVDVLPSLSRLMDEGIGPERTREDHAGVSNQLYAGYAEGRDMRDLVAVVGEEALTSRDRKYLEFADEFEKRFVTQDRNEDRSIEETLDIGWDLLATLPEGELKRIDEHIIKKYHPKYRK